MSRADRAGQGGRLPALHVAASSRCSRRCPDWSGRGRTWRTARSARWSSSATTCSRGGTAEGEAVERPLRDRRPDPEGADDQHADLRGRLPLPGAQGRRALVPDVRRRRRTSASGPSTTRRCRSTWRSTRASSPARSSSRSTRDHRRRRRRSRRSTSSPITWPKDLPAEENARAILGRRAEPLPRPDRPRSRPTRPAASRNPVGPTVIAEYERAGLGPLERWPLGSVADGLALLESFVQPADGRSRLLVHPRCTPADPGLASRTAGPSGAASGRTTPRTRSTRTRTSSTRSGAACGCCYPEGRVPPPSLARVPARQVF